MITQKTVTQLAEEVLEELKKQDYSKGSIQRYSASYRGLKAYTDSQGITNYNEAVGLDYMNHQYGFQLEGFIGTLPKPVSETLHHLLILWHYQQYSSVVFITRGKKKDFVCPESFENEYTAFLRFCSLKKYTVLGLPALNFHFWMISDGH